jgi:hypothetical protein
MVTHKPSSNICDTPHERTKSTKLVFVAQEPLRFVLQWKPRSPVTASFLELQPWSSLKGFHSTGNGTGITMSGALCPLQGGACHSAR